MSWDAALVDDAGALIGAWSYTHNTNRMADLARGADVDVSRSVADRVFAPTHTAWWQILDGMSGRLGKEFLGQIIDGLRRYPARFRDLNPGNGWGDYDGLLAVLQEMYDAVQDGVESTWTVSG